jgi:REP element-mobilizing transposase RayT
MESGQTYHIFNHANGSENIFREEENYRFFLSKYSQYLGEVVDTHAFCLLPNHFHLLVTVKSEFGLRESYTYQVLKKNSRSPPQAPGI